MSALAWSDSKQSTYTMPSLISIQIANISFRIQDSQDISVGSSLIILCLSKNAESLVEPMQSTRFAQLDHRELKVLGALQDHTGISVQLFGIQDVLDNGTKSKNAKQVRNVRVYANIYAPMSLFESVGIFASKVKVFLQEPDHCDRNVQYHNPHRLFPDQDGIQYTQSVKVAQPVEPEVEDIVKPLDLSADPQCNRDLAESTSPKTLETQLHS